MKTARLEVIQVISGPRANTVQTHDVKDRKKIRLEEDVGNKEEKHIIVMLVRRERRTATEKRVGAVSDDNGTHRHLRGN